MRRILVIMFLVLHASAADRADTKEFDWGAKGAELSAIGNYSAAATAYRRALADDEAKGIEDQRTISIHDALAMCYTQMGQFANARSESHSALALLDRIDGHNSLSRGLLLAALVGIPGDEGVDDKTISQLRMAITAHQQTASVNEIALMRVSLAQLLSARKKYAEAETLLLEALADLRKAKEPGPKRLADTLNAIGMLRIQQGRDGEAIPFYDESVRVTENAFGTGYSMLIPLLNNLGTCYLKTRNLQLAATIFERAVKLSEEKLATDHPYKIYVFANYAVVLRKMGRRTEARKLEIETRRIASALHRREGLDSTIGINSLSPPRN
jgi:tetratricopeptide (TPR) repeat protein